MSDPVYDRHGVQLHHGDCLDVLRTLPTASVEAVVTDPPYELAFMGRQWDSTDIAYNVDLWAECLRVLRPGGYVAAFGGTRTYHRMACAVEDAGLRIVDSLHWMHGQGFPKGKGQLKPAHEPIVLARKPAPAPWLNVDACRVGPGRRPDGAKPRGRRPRGMGETGERKGDPIPNGPTYGPGEGGRWPANVLLSHGACDDSSCEPGCPVTELDRQSGMSKSPGTYKRSTVVENHVYGASNERPMQYGHGDTGGASRYFPVFRYQAKAPASERPKVDGVAHSTVKPLALMRWLVRLVTPPGGTIVDPFSGSGTTLEAALLEGFHVIGIEREADYLPLIEHRIGRARATLTAADVEPDDPGLFDVPA